VFKLGSPPDSEGREFDELWKRSMTAIGIRIEFVKQKWRDLLKMSTAGQLQMFRLGRTTTLRDGGVSLEILYKQEHRQWHERRAVQSAGVRPSLRASASPSGQS
jgi:hypothetical protein